MIWAGAIDRRAVVDLACEVDEVVGSAVAERVLGLLDALDIADGLPVVFNDGRPVEEINDFLRHAPVAASSLRRYAGDLAGLARWVLARDVPVLSLSATDLLAYRRALTEPSAAGGRRVGASRWNDLVASFSIFFRWNVAVGRLESSPLPRWPDGRGRCGLRLATTEELKVRFLSADEIRLFRSEGLVADRERVFCDLVLCTGARRAEMARMCWVDLPGANSGRDYETVWVVGKGGKARPCDVPRLVLGQLVDHWLGDREDVVVSHQRLYERRVRDGELVEYRVGPKPDRWGRVRLVRGRDQRAAVGFGDAEFARVVVRRDDGLLDPVALFLGVRHGRMLSWRHWNAAFDAAVCRCVGITGAPVRVTPHMLRHTFAVHLLAALVSAAATAGTSVTMELIEHPLKTVQRALGHASPLTTYRYYIEAAQRCQGHIYRALDEMGQALWQEVVPG